MTVDWDASKGSTVRPDRLTPTSTNQLQVKEGFAVISVRRIGLVVGLIAALGVFVCGGEHAFGADGRASLSVEEIEAIPVIDIDSLDLDAIGQEDLDRQATGLPPVPHR